MLREEQGAAPHNQKQRVNPAYIALAAVAAGAIILAIVLVGLSTGRHRTDGVGVPTTRHITLLPQGQATAAVTNCSTVGGHQVLRGTVTNPLRNNSEIIAINVEFHSATGTKQAGTTVALGPSRIADFTKTVPGSSQPTCRVTKTAVILVLLPGVPYVPANGVSSAVPTPTSLVGRPLG